MNKTAIKNFAIWARNKLIADISYKAGLLGITEKGIKSPLPQSTQTVQFFDIGTKEPSSITGLEIQQRKKLIEEIERKAKQSDYSTAYKNVIEEVAYTWFNRLIAIRFMEVNDYLPTRIRVLSSDSDGKAEPDLVTHALEANLDYIAYEKDRIIQLKHDNKLDELFRMLFIKQCNTLNGNLPELFERTSDYTELLLNVSFTDKEGVVYHLVNDISEDDFNVSKEGQVEIIGWLYQYYNTEPKDETFALLKKNVKITKERIPAATQLFTPDWIVRYMVENSLGRFWIEGHPNEELKSNWKYYLDEVEQEEDVQRQLKKIREEYKIIKPEDIKIIDPAMGSGHILVYAFDVLMQIYESYGYSQRDAAKSIVENNLYGLDIDNRAYQLAYFSVMMKARQYNRRILDGETICNVYAIQESNGINRNQLKYFGAGLSEMEKNAAHIQMQGLLDAFVDAKEYGSILNVENYNWELLRKFINVIDADGQLSLDTIGMEYTKDQLFLILEIGKVMTRKYDVVVTNPPYMGSGSMSTSLLNYIKKNYKDFKSDLFAVFIKKSFSLTKNKGFIAMITQHSWMFLSSYEKVRSYINQNDIINMAHLGAKAFEEIGGEVVQTTTFSARKSDLTRYKASYSRLIEANSQQEKEIAFLEMEQIFNKSKDKFMKIAGSPISYWVSDKYLKIFESNKVIGELANPRRTLQTGDSNRFMREWYEVDSNKICLSYCNRETAINSAYKWFMFSYGGLKRKWFGNLELVVNWENNGSEIKATGKAIIPSEQKYFVENIGWSKVTTGMITVRYYDKGIIPGDATACIFDYKYDHLVLLAYLNSVVVDEILKILSPTLNYATGTIAQIPIIPKSKYDDRIKEVVVNCIDIARNEWNSFETAWDFTKHPLIQGINSIEDSYTHWQQNSETHFDSLKANEEEINRMFIEIYGLESELTPEVDNKDITIRKADLKRDIVSLISYSIGCIFGRYSIDKEGLVYAGGFWDENKYITFIPDKDNIIPITDEEYFKDDIVGLFISFVKKVYGDKNLEENLGYIANVLGKKGVNSREAIRNYFVKDFFNDHCKVYQNKPIYWLFDSGKQNGFKALIYMHRYDENTIGNLRIDYLHRMQRIYENEIARMKDTIENSKDAREVTAATKRKEKLIKQLQETKEYDEKIAHLALARTPIDLDDGVKMNYEKVQTDRDGKKLDVLAKI